MIHQTELIRQEYFCEGFNEWAIHDKALLGDFEYGPYDEAYAADDEEKLTRGLARLDLTKVKEGSQEALTIAIAKLWSNDKLSNPHGVGLAMGPRREWTVWAHGLADLPDQLSAYFAAHRLDEDVHRATLDALSRDSLD